MIFDKNNNLNNKEIESLIIVKDFSLIMIFIYS